MTLSNVSLKQLLLCKKCKYYEYGTLLDLSLHFCGRKEPKRPQIGDYQLMLNANDNECPYWQEPRGAE